jgi:hypothetical protein
MAGVKKGYYGVVATCDSCQWAGPNRTAGGDKEKARAQAKQDLAIHQASARHKAGKRAAAAKRREGTAQKRANRERFR